MIQLTALSEQLLPTQVRCAGSYSVVFAQQKPDGSTKRRDGTLQIHPEAEKVRCHLRIGLELHTLMLPKAPADQLTNQVKQWIDDCANGRLERAA